MKQRTTMYLRDFACPICGTRMLAPKGKLSAKGHVKRMYCFKCKKKQPFEMVGSEMIRMKK